MLMLFLLCSFFIRSSDTHASSHHRGAEPAAIYQQLLKATPVNSASNQRYLSDLSDDSDDFQLQQLGKRNQAIMTILVCAVVVFSQLGLFEAPLPLCHYFAHTQRRRYLQISIMRI